jgi:HPt (histidine-containing phosphotransfer) domain-containing protein
MGMYTNLTFLEKITRGDKEKMSRYIGMFVNQTPLQLNLMTSYLDKQKWDELRVAAHTLKPQITYMGITKLEDVIKHIEQYAGERKSLEQLPGMVEDLKAGCNIALDELTEWLNK